MLMDNLDREAAERPEDLVVFSARTPMRRGY